MDLEKFMETMGPDGQKMPTDEEREAEQPMQKIMPRWLNNVLVMTCTAMTTVLMIIILVLLAKHFKMKALVSMLAIQTVPPPVESVNLTAAMMSAMIAPDPAIGTKVGVCISSGCNMTKYTWIFSASLCHYTIFQTSYLVQRIQV